MAKLTKKQTLGRGLSALLKETTTDVSELIRLKEEGKKLVAEKDILKERNKELKEESKKLDAERDRLLSLIEKLTEELINKK